MNASGKLSRLRTHIKRQGLRSTPRWVYRRLSRNLRMRWNGTEPVKRVSPPISYSVKDAVGAFPSSSCMVIRPASVFHRRPPRTIEPELHPKFVRPGSYDIPERYLAKISGARLVGAPGLVVLPDGSFAAESIFGDKAHLEGEPAYSRPLPSKVVAQSGNYYSLVIQYALAGNYYHWIHDSLLKLYLVREHLPDDTKFIVPPELEPFQYDSLRALNIDKEQLSYFRGDECWDIESLYFSPPTTQSGADAPEADAWLREELLEYNDARSGSATRRLFVSRDRAKHRRLINDKEVATFLASYGFETCLLEGMSLRDQVRLFSCAEVIVAAHGAGLTNMLFAPPGIPVIDILEPLEVNHCYWNMSEALGHEYWYILGDSVSNEGMYPNISLPLDKLHRTLDRVWGE
jgi:hypothetical protein